MRAFAATTGPFTAPPRTPPKIRLGLRISPRFILSPTLLFGRMTYATIICYRPFAALITLYAIRINFWGVTVPPRLATRPSLSCATRARRVRTLLKANSRVTMLTNTRLSANATEFIRTMATTTPTARCTASVKRLVSRFSRRHMSVVNVNGGSNLSVNINVTFARK